MSNEDDDERQRLRKCEWYVCGLIVVCIELYRIETYSIRTALTLLYVVFKFFFFRLFSDVVRVGTIILIATVNQRRCTVRPICNQLKPRKKVRISSQTPKIRNKNLK